MVLKKFLSPSPSKKALRFIAPPPDTKIYNIFVTPLLCRALSCLTCQICFLTKNRRSCGVTKTLHYNISNPTLPLTSIFSCVECPRGEIPNNDLTSCRPIKAIHLEWSSAWALVPAIYSLCGITATMFVVSVFIRYNNTPVVMASGRELCYCMLFGIALCYAVTFVLVSRPTLYVCAAARVLIGLSMCAV